MANALAHNPVCLSQPLKVLGKFGIIEDFILRWNLVSQLIEYV